MKRFQLCIQSMLVLAAASMVAADPAPVTTEAMVADGHPAATAEGPAVHIDAGTVISLATEISTVGDASARRYVEQHALIEKLVGTFRLDPARIERSVNGVVIGPVDFSRACGHVSVGHLLITGNDGGF